MKCRNGRASSFIGVSLYLGFVVQRVALNDFDGPTGEIASVNEEVFRGFIFKKREDKVSDSAAIWPTILFI
jgi:hypothetical protein